MCGRGRFAFANAQDVANAVNHVGATGVAPGFRQDEGDRTDAGNAGLGRQDACSRGAPAAATRSRPLAAVDADLRDVCEVSSRENFGPGMQSWIVVANKDSEQTKVVPLGIVRPAQWGLVRSNQREPVTPGSFYRMFNARSDNLENVHKKLLGRKHCVAVFNGFYEWKSVQEQMGKNYKQPYYIYRQKINSGSKGKESNMVSSADMQPLCLAGLYDEYLIPESGETLRTFTIVTVAAGEKFRWLHHRLPAILLNQESVASWLQSDWGETAKACLVSHDEELSWHPVSRAMGKTSFQESSCSMPIELPKPNVTIGQMFSKMRKAGQLKKRSAESSNRDAKPRMSAASPSSSSASKATVVKPLHQKKRQKTMSAFFAKAQSPAKKGP